MNLLESQSAALYQLTVNVSFLFLNQKLIVKFMRSLMFLKGSCSFKFSQSCTQMHSGRAKICFNGDYVGVTRGYFRSTTAVSSKTLVGGGAENWGQWNLRAVFQKRQIHIKNSVLGTLYESCCWVPLVTMKKKIMQNYHDFYRDNSMHLSEIRF